MRPVLTSSRSTGLPDWKTVWSSLPGPTSHSFENEAFTARLKIILAEGTQNPLIGALFKEKIVMTWFRNCRLAPERLLPAQPDDLQNRVRMLFGMLFSWGLLNILLPDGNTETHYDPEQAAREHVHQFIYGIEADLVRDDH